MVRRRTAIGPAGPLHEYERPVPSVPSRRVLFTGEVVLEESEEGIPVFVADPHNGSFWKVLRRRGNAEEQPLRARSSAVTAQLFEGIEAEREAFARFDADDDTDGLQLFQ